MRNQRVSKETARFSLRPVILGLLLGLISLIFGIFWAAYITVNHERIHRTLSESASAALHEKFVVSPVPTEGHQHHASPEKASAGAEHGKSGHNMHDEQGENEHAKTGHGVKDEGIEAPSSPEAMHEAMHEDSLMEAAHERLTRGHLHAMGLGTLSILVSFIFAFSTAPANVKTFASACLGTGGIFYPLSWIIMGFRTPALGMEAAQESVVPIVALSMLLVLVGLLLCFFYFIRDFFRYKV
ncbi:MAG: hypothetical protein HY893_04480 [Deltaproteobacteria bacterium]|nr:hypothetical protein [Deltaproteobacteria bacterium]